jgi:hypothetical protein
MGTTLFISPRNCRNGFKIGSSIRAELCGIRVASEDHATTRPVVLSSVLVVLHWKSPPRSPSDLEGGPRPCHGNASLCGGRVDRFDLPSRVISDRLWFIGFTLASLMLGLLSVAPLHPREPEHF